MIGQILTDMGFVTHQQLEEALDKQRRALRIELLPERVRRDSLVAEARMAARAEATSLLGKILIEMGLITEDQLSLALSRQQGALQVKYAALDAGKLGTAVELGHAINSTLSLARVLSLIMINANRVTKSAASSIMLLDEQTGELVFGVPTGPAADSLIDVRIPPGEGIAGWVAQRGEHVIVPKASEDPRFYPGVDKISGLETRTILCVPLTAKAKVIGVLEAINKANGGEFTEEDARLLNILALQAAIAIENARLYDELRQRWEEERQIKQELAQVEKLKALGQMASGIAHDFGNILTAIVGQAELAVEGVSRDHAVHESIEQIIRASRRANDLIKQMLAYSREGEQKRVPVEVGSIVREVLGLLRVSIPAAVGIHEDIASGACTVSADPAQIHQVLMNLCVNAAHAVGEKEGIIEVAVGPVDADAVAVIERADLGPGTYVKLSVRDNGHGMDSATVARIFDPYFTTKQKDQGTGM